MLNALILIVMVAIAVSGVFAGLVLVITSAAQMRQGKSQGRHKTAKAA
jgi:hypothetical protein